MGINTGVNIAASNPNAFAPANSAGKSSGDEKHFASVLEKTVSNAEMAESATPNEVYQDEKKNKTAEQIERDYHVSHGLALNLASHGPLNGKYNYMQVIEAATKKGASTANFLKKFDEAFKSGNHTEGTRCANMFNALNSVTIDEGIFSDSFNEESLFRFVIYVNNGDYDKPIPEPEE
jgi:hypothetical protein